MRHHDARRAFAFAVLATLLGTAGRGLADKFPWEKPPGPIAGKWQTTCANRGAMVVEIVVEGETKAVGRIVQIGNGAHYGYSLGEEVLKLEANLFGVWVGQLQWRGYSGDTRWDPIQLVATDGFLDATITTDDCYKKMPRVK